MKYLALVTCFLVVGLSVFSQETDSIYTLPSLEISASRLNNFSAGQKLEKLDTLTATINQTLNLGEILSRNSSIQIKSYNHNGLELISFRGTSAHHTGVYWNGFQLNPPNNGQVDFSLVPVGYFNDISILYGGSSTLYGSGNIGGGIHLNNLPVFKENLTANILLSAGSFGELGGNGSIGWSDGKWFLKTGVIYKSATNDFKYTNLKGEEVRQKNAAFQQYGIMQDIYRKFGKKSILGLSFWFQSNEREIPPTLTTSESDATQLDRSIRGSVFFKEFYKSGNLEVKVAYFDDLLHYKDPDTITTINIDSEIKTRKSIADGQYKHRFNTNMNLCGGMVFSTEVGQSVNYESDVVQNQLGLYVLWSHFIPAIKWKYNVNLRKEFINGYDVPFTPSVGFEGQIWKMISGKLNISRNYRVPSFNDRYWVPGGNPNLKPEDSWNQEASIIFSGGKINSYSLTTTGFSSIVDNWILWVPDGNLWSPQNVQKVWARGLEVEGNLNLQFAKWKILLQTGYTYARSTNEIKQGANDNSYQKQLLYIPEHRFFVTASIVWKGFIVRYNHSYTGLQYTTIDNEESLPAYALGNFTIRKEFSYKTQQFSAQVDILNCWNKEYQAYLYNPMPGRYFKFSINYLISKS